MACPPRSPRALGRAGCQPWREFHAAVLAGLATGLVCSCEEAPQARTAPTAAPATVRVVPVVLEPVNPSVRVAGAVDAEARVDVPFQVSGLVAEVLVEEGERVEHGQVLARLDTARLERNLRIARAELRRAAVRVEERSGTLKRQRRLYESGAASRQRYEQARWGLDVARAEHRLAGLRVEAAAEDLRNAELVAPMDGFIERRLAIRHEAARATTAAFVIVDLDTLVVRAQIADSLGGFLRPGLPIAVRSPLRPEGPLGARILRVDLSADPATGLLSVEAELEDSLVALKPGMIVDLELPIAARRTAILVPLGAILRDSISDPFCFVARVGWAERRMLELGGLHGRRVEVRSGLAPGDLVIVEGQHFLVEGDPVRIGEG